MHLERIECTVTDVARTSVGCTQWGVEIHDDSGSRTIPIGPDGVTVGAAAAMDIVVADFAVSGRHCELRANGNGVRVRDLGSKNGTYCGAARVNEAWATIGTIITVGTASLKCVDLTPNRELDEQEEAAAALPGMAGCSAAMRKVAAQVARIAPLSVPVLISGETGTGKELVAHALHTLSPRRVGAYVPLNVANLPRDLVESELFGHERGAFTGAVARKAGAFEEAAGGTIFLDEIGELPLDAQPKLLRALDGYEIRRVGGVAGRPRANARVVAATHVPLQERVNAGLFRRDLFHRLEVFVVRIAPLRERREDVLPMAKAFLRSARSDLGERRLTSRAAARLSAHDWPGNARELRNALYRAADAARSSVLVDAEHVEAAISCGRPAAIELTPARAKQMYAASNGNVSAAARLAGYPRSTFRKLLAQALGPNEVPSADPGSEG